jgi:hypothetical protein
MKIHKIILFLMSNSNSHLIQKLNIKKILRRLKLKLKKT